MQGATSSKDEDLKKRTRSSFASYLKGMARWPYPPEGVPVTSEPEPLPGWRGLVLRVLSGPWLLTVRILLTRIHMKVQRSRLEPSQGALRIHLGSGEVHLPEWRNVDLMGSQADFYWDLRRPLPAQPGTATAVFSEHFLEHLPLPAATAMLRQCHTLMASGAVLRVGVPDFHAYFMDYVEGAGMLERARPERPTPLIALSELVYSYGHSSLWDDVTLCALLEEIGFVSIRVCPFGVSLLDPAPDSAFRSEFGPTLYVEALKS